MNDELQIPSNFIHINTHESVFVSFIIIIIYVAPITCVITPGLICKGWIGGAWVTRGTDASIRTE